MSDNLANPDVESCARLLAVWCMRSMFTGDDNKVLFNPEYEEVSFIAKILRKKMEVFGIDVKLPDPLIMLIEVCTRSNPGISQLMLKEIFRKSKIPLQSGQTVIPLQFALAFGDSFPVMSNPEWEEKWTKMWDDQKDDKGQNKCDTPEWWRDL